MGGPINSGGTWWQQQPDGSWLWWNESSQNWVPHVPAAPVSYVAPAYAPQPYAGTTATGPRAGFGKRLIASLVDGLILGIPLVGLGFLSMADDIRKLAEIDQNDTRAAFETAVHWQGGFYLLQLLALVVAFAYYGVMEGGPSGQTLGKKLVGIRVIDYRTGGPIGIGRGMLRLIGRYISQIPCGLGYFWMLWDNEKQTWHDKICDCVVVPVSSYPIVR